MRLVFGNLRQTQLAFSARMQTGIRLSLSLHCNFFQHSVTSVVRLGCSFIAAGAGSWRCWTRWQDSHRKTHENRVSSVFSNAAEQNNNNPSVYHCLTCLLLSLPLFLSHSFLTQLPFIFVSLHTSHHLYLSLLFYKMSPSHSNPIGLLQCDNKEYSCAFAW